MNDVLIDGFSVMLTAEQWNSEIFQGSSNGGEIEYETGSNTGSMKLNIGTYFSLFKTDYYQDLGERTTAQTVYIKGRIPIGESYSVRLAMESESSIEEYQTLKIGVRRDF